MKSVLASLVAILGLAGCSPGDRQPDPGHGPGDATTEAEAAPPDERVETIRGHYVFGHEVRSLRPCGKDEALWVIDRSNQLQTLHGELANATTPYEEIFVVIVGRPGPPPDRGFGADYAGIVTVQQVLYAAGEGLDCGADWGGFRYLAQGNEPFWSAVVTAEEIRLRRPGEPDRIWPGVTEQRAGNAGDSGHGVVFRAGGEGGAPVDLVIENHPGRDPMSGAYYGLSARLTLEGRTFTGHALPGTLP